MKKLLAWALAAAMLLTLPACTPAEPEIQATGTPETTFPGVEIRIVNVQRTDRDRLLHVKWINNTNYKVLYGEVFGIQRLENGQWVDCALQENTAFITIGYQLEPNSYAQKKYALAWAYDVSQPGTYRFVTNCTVYDTLEGSQCKLWAEFTVEGVENPGSSEETLQPNPSYGQGDHSQPPALTVKIGTETLEAVKGTYSWNYAVSGGQWAGTVADCLHPLQMGSLLTNHETTREKGELVFEVQPDSYIVRCWPDSMLRDGDVSLYDGQSQDLTVNLYTVYFEPSTTGGYVYEVTATWNDNGGSFYGEATYVFYVTSYPVDPLNDEIMPWD